MPIQIWSNVKTTVYKVWYKPNLPVLCLSANTFIVLELGFRIKSWNLWNTYLKHYSHMLIISTCDPITLSSNLAKISVSPRKNLNVLFCSMIFGINLHLQDISISGLRSIGLFYVDLPQSLAALQYFRCWNCLSHSTQIS